MQAQKQVALGQIILGVKEDEPSHLNKGEVEYDPFLSPPNFELAKTHGIAKRVYRPKDATESALKVQTCPCCGLPLKGTPIPVTCTIKSLYHLGVGYPLYFSFLKFSICVLAILFSISGVYNIISDIMGKDCPEPNGENDKDFCLKDYISLFHIANKRDHDTMLNIQLILNLIALIAVMFFFQYIRFRFRKIIVEADDRTVTPADYNVRLAGIPLATTDEELKAWIEHFSTTEMPLRVMKILRAPDLRKYMTIFRKKTKLEQQRDKEEDQTNKDIIQQDINKIDIELKSLKKSLTNTKVGFVAFEKAIQADAFKNFFKKSLLGEILDVMTPFLNSKLRLQGKRISAERAPEPTDIMWENLGFDNKTKFTHRAATIFGTLFCVAIGFGLIILINWAQLKIIEGSNSKGGIVTVLSVVASMAIITINTVLGRIIRTLSLYEDRSTITGYYMAVSDKLSWAQFVNCAFTNLVAKLILASQNSNESGLDAINFYGSGGLIQNIYYVFLTNAFMTPIFNFFDIFYLLKLNKQKKELAKGKESKMIQKDAQILFEGPTVDPPSRYAPLLKMLLLTSFYASALPFAMIFTIIGLFLSYWTDKYLLIKRQALPVSMGQELAESMVELLEWTAFMFAIGNLIFATTLQDSQGDHSYDDKKLIYAGIGISLFHILFPMQTLNEWLFKIKDDVTENLKYEEAKVFKFATDYDIECPITKKKGLNDLQRLKEQFQVRGMIKNQGGLKFNLQGIIANNEPHQGDYKTVHTNDMQNIINHRELKMNHALMPEVSPGTQSIGVEDEDDDEHLHAYMRMTTSTNKQLRQSQFSPKFANKTMATNMNKVLNLVEIKPIPEPEPEPDHDEIGYRDMGEKSQESISEFHSGGLKECKGMQPKTGFSNVH